jgi:hypothetical protein
MATLKEAVSTLLDKGAKLYEGVKVKTATPSEDYQNNPKIKFYTDTPVIGFTGNSENRTQSESNTFSVTICNLMNFVREDVLLSGNASAFEEKLSRFAVFNGSKINVIAEFVAAGEEHANPFTGRIDEFVSDYDRYFYYVVAATLSEEGLRANDKIYDKVVLGL